MDWNNPSGARPRDPYRPPAIGPAGELASGQLVLPQVVEWDVVESNAVSPGVVVDQSPVPVIWSITPTG